MYYIYILVYRRIKFFSGPKTNDDNSNSVRRSTSAAASHARHLLYYSLQMRSK